MCAYFEYYFAPPAVDVGAHVCRTDAAAQVAPGWAQALFWMFSLYLISLVVIC